METALLAALAEGAGGDGGRRAVEELARAVGLDADASVRDIAEAAMDPAWQEAVREWGSMCPACLPPPRKALRAPWRKPWSAWNREAERPGTAAITPISVVGSSCARSSVCRS